MHTSVIDTAGAIYVIGGYDGTIYFNGVWASTDGGARPVSVGGRSGGTLGGYYGGTKGYSWVLKRYCSGYSGVLQGVLVGTRG